MTDRTSPRKTRTDIIAQNRIFVWIALATACVLLVPLVAMQFTSEVDWRTNDFVVASALLFGAGTLFVLAARMAPRYRAVLAIVFAAGLFYLWVELAVGVFTDWGS
jgi:hypothetical protein